jgi:hypothetical protein
MARRSQFRPKPQDLSRGSSNNNPLISSVNSPDFWLEDHFLRSLRPSTSLRSSTRKRPLTLREIARESLFSKAIERIANAVAGMPWTVTVDEEKEKDPKIKEKVAEINKALAHPSRDLLDTYHKLVSAIVRNLLIFNVAAVERQSGTIESEKGQLFWLWLVPVEDLIPDPDWSPDIEGIHPRFWYAPRYQHSGSLINHPEDWEPVMSDRVFLISQRVSDRDFIYPSPVQNAYKKMMTWIELYEYQARTVSNPVRDYMICLEEESHDGLESFRQYWDYHIEGSGKIPIVAGKVNTVKFGARNDEELFLKFAETLANIIALEFGLSKRDFGVDPHDNRSTLGPAADISFQDAILPIAQCVVEQHLSLQVVQYYAEDSSIKLKLADTEPRKELEESQSATTLFDSKLITRNEARARVGEEPLSISGNVFSDGQKADEEPQPPQTQETNEPKKSAPSGNPNKPQDSQKAGI